MMRAVLTMIAAFLVVVDSAYSYGHCPSRPAIPSVPYSLPPQLLEDAKKVVRETLAACTNSAPLTPTTTSATAVAGGILVGGKTEFFNYGCVDKKAPRVAPTPSTIFRIGSVSKVLVAELLLRAVLQGRIASLDDEAREYVPDFFIRNPYEDKQPTWRMLASQLGSVPRMGPCAANCPFNTTTMLAKIKEEMRLVAPLNSMPSYSNLAFAVVGNVLGERVYGMESFAAALKLHVLQPLKMDSTGLDLTEEVRKRMATFYSQDGKEVPWQDLGWYSPAGALYSSSADMASLLREILTGWRKSGWRKEALQPIYINADQTTGWGMPWEIHSGNGYLYRTKIGGLAGVRATMLLVPELDFAVWCLWNGEGMDPTGVAEKVANMLVPHLVDAYVRLEAQSFPTVSSAWQATYCGTYVSRDGLGTAIVSVEKEGNLTYGKLSVDSMQIDAYLRSSDEPLRFQLWSHRHQRACTRTQFEAVVGAWVHFGESSKGRSLQVLLPGLVYSPFTKI